jgi:hypothetical protein
MAEPITGINVTTSNDIFIEISGKRIAGVQSYSTKYNKDTKPVDVFGQDVPIGYIHGKKKHTLDLSRVYLEDTAVNDGIDFYTLADNQFNVVIIKNGQKVTYSDCIVTDIGEDGSLNDKVVEKMTISALKRKKG